MENKKTEKKRIFSKLTVCVAALALVSCAFVGGTFARYTSQGEVDNGGANVADWYIDVINGSGTAQGTLTISPDDAVYNAENGPRSHRASEGGAVLTFYNGGEVTAEITINTTAGYVVTGKTYDSDTRKFVDSELPVGSSAADMAGNMFKWVSDTDAGTYKPDFDTSSLDTVWENVTLVGGTGSSGNVILKVGTLTYNGTDLSTGTKITLAPGATATIEMGEVTWTSDFADENGSAGDQRDTWIGQNISRVGYEINWSAVQVSEQPQP